jgi:hypothetical protein
MRVLKDGEATSLKKHLCRKAEEHYAAVGGDLGNLQTFEDWLQFQFCEALEEDAEAGPDYSKAFNLLSVLTIAAGLASSVVANTAGDSAVVIGILGVAVGVFTAVNRIWNPAQRSIVRYQAAYALRREGWDFVNDLGRYKDLGEDMRLEAFMNEVGRIHRGVESVDEAAMSGGGEE